MHKMSNLEYSFIVTELSKKIVGKHFGRIRKIGDNIYRMKIGGSEIICELGVRVHETLYIEKSDSDDKFTEKIDKELDNSRLLGLRQINNDRILSFDFDKGSIIFEMFGEGNAIFVQQGLVVCAHRYESWSDRQVKAGAPYSPPKNVPSENIELTDKYIIVSLMKLPLGKEYAIEALLRCGIDEKTPGKSVSGNQLMRLEQEIRAIKESASPHVFYRGEKAVEFALAKLSRLKDMEFRDFPTLGEAMDEYYSKLEKENPLLQKLNSRFEKQQERMLALKAEEQEYRSKGEFIYSHFAEAEGAITMAMEGTFDPSWKVDKKEKSIELEIQ